MGSAGSSPQPHRGDRAVWPRSVLLAIAILAAATPASAAYWDVEPVYSDGMGSGDTSLAISAANIPNVSYAANGFLYRAEKQVGSWTQEPVAKVGFWGGLSSIAFNGAGQPCIAFIDASGVLTNYLKYAYKSASWTVETIQEIGWLGDHVSLAMGQSGQPCIAYCRTGASDTCLSFARRAGPNWWLTEDITPIGSITGPALAFDSSGAAYVAFAESVSGCLKVARSAGGPWTIQTIDGGPGALVIPYPAITIQPNGKPALAYFVSGSSSSELRLAAYDGASWSIQTAAALGPSRVGHCSVCVTNSGMPMICFQDPATACLKNAWRTDSTWVTEFVDSAPRTGGRPSMKLDGLGNVDVSYFDSGGYNVKFAWAIAPTTVHHAKSLPDGRVVQISGIVASTASDDLSGLLYAQAPDRTSGIQLRFPTVVPQVARGDILDVQGPLTTVNGERALNDPLVVAY